MIQYINYVQNTLAYTDVLFLLNLFTKLNNFTVYEGPRRKTIQKGIMSGLLQG